MTVIATMISGGRMILIKPSVGLEGLIDGFAMLIFLLAHGK